MNEAQIRNRLREAVGEASNPAGSLGRIEAQLRHAAAGQDGRAFPRRGYGHWLVGLRRPGSLAAAILAVLLIAALVVGVNAWRNGDLNPRPAPGVRDPLINQYQALVSADQQRWFNVPAYNCNTFVDAGCLPAVALETAALQQWLDDLNRSQSPARFVALDALMRHHLALAISTNNAFVTAYRAKDDKGTTTATVAHQGEVDALGREAADIIASSQGTIASHTSAVRADRAYLLACALCQRLVGKTQVSCQGSQTPACLDEVAAVRLQVETFQSDLVFDVAPDSLAAKDAPLQGDLVNADGALDAMESALAAGDQFRFQAGLYALRQALGRVDSDAADMVGRN